MRLCVALVLRFGNNHLRQLLVLVLLLALLRLKVVLPKLVDRFLPESVRMRVRRVPLDGRELGHASAAVGVGHAHAHVAFGIVTR
jgi:predicted PurR-regulated permease PerM